MKTITVHDDNLYYFAYNNILYDYNKKLVFCPPAIETIEFLDGVEKIGNESFVQNIIRYCYNLPNTTKEIENYAFSRCYSLEYIYLPDKIEKIGDSAFFFCSKLKSIVLPNSLVSISSYLFQNCYSLESIYIHDSITSIDKTAFLNTPLTCCGIFCSNRMRIFLKQNLDLINSSFYPCSSETLHCRKFSVLPFNSIYLCLYQFFTDNF